MSGCGCVVWDRKKLRTFYRTRDRRELVHRRELIGCDVADWTGPRRSWGNARKGSGDLIRAERQRDVRATVGNWMNASRKCTDSGPMGIDERSPNGNRLCSIQIQFFNYKLEFEIFEIKSCSYWSTSWKGLSQTSHLTGWSMSSQSVNRWWCNWLRWWWWWWGWWMAVCDAAAGWTAPPPPPPPPLPLWWWWLK